MLKLFLLFMVSSLICTNSFGEQILIETIEPTRRLPNSPSSNRIGHFDNIGKAIGSYPAQILLNFQLFYIGPRNAKNLIEAVEKERKSLKPGETKAYQVYAKRSGATVTFFCIVEKGKDILLSGNEFVVSEINISKPRLLFPSKLEYFTEAQHKKCVELKLCDERITYADHKFAVDYLNTVQGTTENTSMPKQIKPIELLDMRAIVGMDATVILVASANSDKYKVWNSISNKIEHYNKGKEIKKKGNTLWLLAKLPDGRRYTIVYNQLNTTPNIEPGKKVNARDSLGLFSDTPEAGYSVWRVKRADQYFLKNGAYRIAPVD